MVGLVLAMKREGSSPRKRSQWVSGALQNLLSLGAGKIFDENIFVGDRINENAIGQVLYVDDDLSNALDSMIYDLRRIDPLIEDVQSVLIRAAIRRRVNEGREAR